MCRTCLYPIVEDVLLTSVNWVLLPSNNLLLYFRRILFWTTVACMMLFIWLQSNSQLLYFRGFNVLTVACMNKLDTNNFECFEMIFFKPNNMPLSFASKNFILKCLSTFEQAQTNITQESSLKKGYLSIMTMKHPVLQFEKRYILKAIL